MSRVFHIFANRMNIGDWLAARAIKTQLSRHETVGLLCDADHVEETIGTLRDATEDDCVVIGGGGLLMDYFMPFWKGFAPIAHRVRFAIWGVGMCDMKQRASSPDRELLRAVLSQARVCILRDQLSREFFPELQLADPVPCPCVLAVERPKLLGNAILHAVHQEILGEGHYAPLVRLIQGCADATGRHYLETNNEVPDADERALLDEVNLYAQSELIVSSRLHGCILGLAHGCKVLALSGDRKIESFMGAAGLGEWICDPQDFPSIRRLIAQLSQQADVTEFVKGVRRANIEIGQTLNRLIEEKTVVKSP